MALSAGYFYAALIFSFLGGLWWGMAVANPRAPKWLYAAAVVPSLLAFSSGIPWMIGARWPAPSLVVLAIGLVAALLVDLRLNKLGIIKRAGPPIPNNLKKVCLSIFFVPLIFLDFPFNANMTIY